MISRRRILSRPRDVLFNNDSQNSANHNLCEEEDVWYSKDKLYKDHILEIYKKWSNIDDEIWAKIIVLERNRRIAKAYARAPILTINGSANGFDGYHIGLNGFNNPLRDTKTEVIKQNVGDGVKIRMDDNGNILIKRLTKGNVYIKGWRQLSDGTNINEIIVSSNELLEVNKTACLFNMNQFQSSMGLELRRAYPDRSKLENQCISFISFGKDELDQLELPIWVMVINIVALEMLKSSFQSIITKRQSVPNIMLALKQQKSPTNDEDQYSLLGNNSSSSESHTSGHYVSTGNLPTQKSTFKQSSTIEPKPPKLPPRDFELKQKSKYFSKNSKTAESINSIASTPSATYSHDDPYYSGFIARVPNYTKQSNKKDNDTNNKMALNMAQFKSNNDNKNKNNKNNHNNNNNQELHSRKMSSKGFLNSILKSSQIPTCNNIICTTYCGSLAEYDPYTMLNDGHGGNDNVAIYADSTYDRIGIAHRYEPIIRPNKKLNIPPSHWMYRSRCDNQHCEWDD